MSYSRRITTSDGRRQGRPLLFWLFGAAIAICVLGAIGHALFPGIYSWITRTGQYADIVTVKVTNTGFESRSVTLSTDQHLHIVNASSHPVVICPGIAQICNQDASSDTIPAAGLQIQPGKTYDLSLKGGSYSLTIMPQVDSGFDVTNLDVAVHIADSNVVDSNNDDSDVDSGGDSDGSNVSSGVSSSSDNEEENSTSSGSSISSGVSSSSDDEEENSTSSSSSSVSTGTSSSSDNEEENSTSSSSSVSSETSSSSDDEENSTSSSTSSGADDSSSAGGDDGGDE